MINDAEAYNLKRLHRIKTYAELVDDVESARETLEDISDVTSALRGTQEHRDARKAYAAAIDALTEFNQQFKGD